MPRVKRGTVRRAKRHRLLARAKGFFQTKSKLYRAAQQAVEKSLGYAYVGRKLRKRDFRRLWIVRINAAARENGLTYRELIHGLKAGRRDARPEDAGRPRGDAARRLCGDCRQGEVRGAGRGLAPIPRKGSGLISLLRTARRSQARPLPGSAARRGGTWTSRHSTMSDATIIAQMRADYAAALDQAASDRDLQALRDRFLGRKHGLVTGLFGQFGKLPPDQKRELGQQVNALKQFVETTLEEKRAALAPRVPSRTPSTSRSPRGPPPRATGTP